MPSDNIVPDLPRGFSRKASGSLRVQIRLKGHNPAVKYFPLLRDSTEERRRQMAEAQAWATEARRKMLAGIHVSSRAAERTTLAEALRRYANEGLKGRKKENVEKEGYRINAILSDPIADRPLASLRKTDLSAFRDRLLHAGWLKSVEAAEARLKRELARRPPECAALKTRLKAVQALPALKRRSQEAGCLARGSLEKQVEAVEHLEGIRMPARTTISNVVQLVNRSAKFMTQYVDGVPEIGGVPMPKSAPSRERRPSEEELEALLDQGKTIDTRLPLIIRFAISTALRRERILAFRTSYCVPIGKGSKAIVFPRETAVSTKRTGIVPVTSEIQCILNEALALQGHASWPAGIDLSIWGDYKLEAFRSAWRRLIAKTGIHDLHFHDLRHEATSRLFEQGLTTAEVMSVTGHSTTDMIDRYSHYSATIVLEKLEGGTPGLTILRQLKFLASQFKSSGGDMRLIKEIFSELSS